VRRRRRNTRGRSRSGPARQGAPAGAARPPISIITRAVAADVLTFKPQAFIFDVEGTLVDNVLAMLQCWSETLAEIGHPASVADLHPFSGMDGRRMLRRVLNRHDSKPLDHVLKLQDDRYRQRYLPHIRPFPGLRRLFTAIKESGAKIALASPCSKEEFTQYRSIMNVDDLIDAACCGDDIKREKPSLDVVGLAAKKLRLPPAQIAMVGDTPYDADAARAAGLLPIGLQSGHFSRFDLSDAGYAAVFFDLRALAAKLEEHKPPPQATPESAEPFKSHTAAAADSR
jgi:phosphoglycolate phosphatase-like HAD superfamily hydrolase